ncbi:hypothetical protein WDZ17_12855 [Pseudokineococcus basanitobsidens]|uniref:Uncharacterized protein n=1 Tax=Pseudokineococcus basanitobsidens TaxID=1926649 RepID=A0ABU8RM77_9ACTN
MFAVALTLILLGALLPLCALAWAWRVTKREHDDLRDRLARVGKVELRQARDKLGKPWPGAAEYEKQDARDRAETDEIVKPRRKAWEVTYIAEFTRTDILAAALDDLRGPAVLTAVGVAFGTAGSALSLWL